MYEHAHRFNVFFGRLLLPIDVGSLTVCTVSWCEGVTEYNTVHWGSWHHSQLYKSSNTECVVGLI